MSQQHFSPIKRTFFLNSGCAFLRAKNEKSVTFVQIFSIQPFRIAPHPKRATEIEAEPRQF